MHSTKDFKRRHIPAPCEKEIGFVFVDHDLVVVEKPSGLLSIPGRYVRDSVLHRVFFEYSDVKVVHRLDLDTSGLMVLARSRWAARELSRQFREREVDKLYEAFVWGDMEVGEGEIAAPLAPDAEHKPRHKVDFVAGKEALTRYSVLRSAPKTSHLLLQPLTGRSHQLRVHLAHIGHPVLGCDLYAHEEARAAVDRLMLHARKLSFTHPATRERLSFDAVPQWRVPLDNITNT